MAEYIISDCLTGSVEGKIEHTSRANQTILYINEFSSSQSKFIRILLGAAKIKHDRENVEWGQNRDFSILGLEDNTVITREDFRNQLLLREMPLDDLDTHIRTSLRQESFYKDLLGEITRALHFKHQDQNTIAFIHIYRLLERISFAFPVMYAAKSTDFKSSFANLKSFFSGQSEAGELAFFEKFVDVSIEDTLRLAKATVDLSPLSVEDRIPVYTVILKFIPERSQVSQIPNQSLEFKYSGVLELLINLRNRFFHFNSSHNANISTEHLPVSDHLFERLNDIFINWIAAIYFEILRSFILRQT